VIFQLIDDHSRLALASHVDTGETARGALTVVRKAIDAHGVPQKFLSDNGLAFNVSRRGWISQLMGYLAPMGVQMVTGKPATPTTQGKNERFHQSLFQWLDRRPDPDSIPGMQALVDEFDVHYNTQRRHQSLSYRDSQGRTYRLTPQQAWDATPVATPPQPPDPVDQTDPSANSPTASSPGRAGWRENLAQSVQDSRAGKTRRSPVGEHLRIPDSGHDIRVVNARGYASFRGVRFKIGPVSLWAGVSVHVAWDPDCITFAGPDGEVLAIHEHPPAGVSYIGSGRPPGRPPKDPNAPG
jgi:putative transposase